jgi:hypothetical protein
MRAEDLGTLQNVHRVKRLQITVCNFKSLQLARPEREGGKAVRYGSVKNDRESDKFSGQKRRGTQGK